MNLFNKNKHLPAFVLLSSVCFGQYQFEVKNASKSYDAVIQVENCYDGQCNGRGTVDLFDHRNTKVQTFVSDNLVLNLNQDEKPVQGKIFQLKKENGPVVIDDFNFDGTEDIAIRNGNMGNYSSSSYDVYVFNSTKMAFVKSKELTELASDSFDIFEVDAKRKRLIAYGKSGCCDLFTTEYAVIPNKGLDKVFEKEEDMTVEDLVKVTTKEKINNKWITKTKVYPSDQYNRNKK
ncbi:XAC2610-related protein [Chryseobacterium sp. IT-36CA2]|uniref:XAC2610-related protein n=1 Tax=Chryseobacterium sp. IT-36CA2 TaxID=3026460 RepID=UPI0039E0E85A